MTVAAALIAGGRALRLGGKPKHLLLVGGKRIAERQIEALRPLFRRVFAVTNDPGSWRGLGVATHGDRDPRGIGPLAGIDAALAALDASDRAVVCVACDMPFLDPRALELVRDYAPEAQAAVPRVAGRPEPLFARYDRTCASAVRAQIETDDYRMARFLDRLPAVAWIAEEALRAIDPALGFLTNVNTPEDLAAVATPP